MNQKGIASVIVVGGVVVIVAIVALAALLFGQQPAPGAIDTYCISLQAKYSDGAAWEDVCVDPGNQEIKDSVTALNVSLDNLPVDRQSIVKVTCTQAEGAWTVAGEMRSCETWQACDKNNSEHSAICTGAQPVVCNSNGVCDAGENTADCPNDCDEL